MNVKAFSILELLIVIAIISILAALVFPTITGTRGRAYETRCTSNLRQLYLAAQLYASDYGGPPPNNYTLPPWRDYVRPNSLTCPFGDLYMRPIVGDYAVAFDISRMKETRIRCAEVRGPALPVAYDDNHARTVPARSVGRRVWLFVRADGSASNVGAAFYQAFNNDPSRFPCPYADAEDNY